DIRAGELRKNGVKIKLQEQPFRVLVALLQHPGDIVTREELRRELWPSDTFVDFEHGLNAAVKRLRDALGDSAENPIFIETLARRGSIFSPPTTNRASFSTKKFLFAPPATTHSSHRSYLLGLASTAFAVIALLAAFNWVPISRWRTGASTKSIESLAVLPLENLSRHPEQEDFSDGMTDALTSQLYKACSL